MAMFISPRISIQRRSIPAWFLSTVAVTMAMRMVFTPWNNILHRRDILLSRLSTEAARDTVVTSNLRPGVAGRLNRVGTQSPRQIIFARLPIAAARLEDRQSVV